MAEQIRELRSEEEWLAAFACLQTLRPNLKRESFLASRLFLRAQNFHLCGLFEDTEVVCAASYVLQPHIERGTEFWVHDFATIESKQKQGYGVRMAQHLREIAASEKCSRVMLHLGTPVSAAQRFFEQHAGFSQYGVLLSAPVAVDQKAER